MKATAILKVTRMALVKKLHCFFISIPEGIKQIKKKKEKENPFWLKNGGILLEELISTCNGVYNPIRIFSIKELQTATNNFQSLLEPRDLGGSWYKGTLDGRPILVKEYNVYDSKKAYRDIAISIKMSDHNNVLKFIGCCLEIQNPISVFEDAEVGTINRRLEINSSESCSFPWKKRLKVAKDIAHALTFLHTAFATPIVHRDIKPMNILLDKDYNAKLTDFSLSISIPEGETIVQDDVTGTFGYADPEYIITGYVSEQSDVFSFGAFMIVLLTGKSLPALTEQYYDDPFAINVQGEYEMAIRCYINHKPLDEVVDSRIWEEEGGIRQEQRLELEAYLQLALRCTEYKSGDRPLMIDVAKELRQIERAQPHNPGA